MRRNKKVKEISELDVFNNSSEKLVSSLILAMNMFNLKRAATIFDFIKSKGFAISSLISILVILPFLGFATVNALTKAGIKVLGVISSKDPMYDIKNNELIEWRKLLMLYVKRFLYLINHNVYLKKDKKTALIIDDTVIRKTGKKIEFVSVVHDHTTDVHVLGYKLLVCGFWDGGSLIPIDFSFHREKGRQHEKLQRECNKLEKEELKQEKEFKKLEERRAKCQKRLNEQESKYRDNPTKTNKQKLASSQAVYDKVNRQYKEKKAELSKTKYKNKKSQKALKRFYDTGKLYGLSPKERQAQYKKGAQKGSAGKQRRQEANESKIKSMLKMISRAVKHGIVPNYVMVDSWFFCSELLEKLNVIKNGRIKLISMIKIGNQIFTISKEQSFSLRNLLNIKKRKPRTNRKYKSKYIQVACSYKGIRINLFFVKRGKGDKWHLLATTDLSLNFNQLIELYQTRWSIETFFRDMKQYLKLGSCQSNCFDAQIADVTISMLQYIMLIFFKRVNYQQSFGELFKNVSSELIKTDIVTRLLEILNELINLICDIAGISILDLQKRVLTDDKILAKYQELFPEKVIDTATLSG